MGIAGCPQSLCFTAGRDMNYVDCTPDRHAGAVLAIYNEYIRTSASLYEYEPRTPAAIERWFAEKREKGFPVIGAENSEGDLLGFATYGTFRVQPGYKYTVEHSLYLRPDAQGRGIGSSLLERLITEARKRDVHVMVASIDADNAASVALHRKFGFECAGTLRQTGFKFGRWLDMTFYQLILETPFDPVDG